MKKEQEDAIITTYKNWCSFQPERQKEIINELIEAPMSNGGSNRSILSTLWMTTYQMRTKEIIHELVEAPMSFN